VKKCEEFFSPQRRRQGGLRFWKTAGTKAPARADNLLNDAFSPHNYQLLYRCRGSFTSPMTFGKNVLKIDWGFKF
jgi:hypothetical protein